ncbi:MAG: hypothetical protein HY273_11485 [Gammaproteobacteria bacterium]|nr:hypothetical protein [Gammaproteobacteria bacterium]
MAKVEQWVNLPKDKLFVEDEVTGLERVNFVHVECEFKKAKPANFKIRIVPLGSQANYTKKERKNKQFKLQDHLPIQSNAAGKLVKLEKDIYLPAAGGNKFKIEAKYKKDVVMSDEIETRRKLYYQVIKMKGMTATVKTLTDHLEDEFWNTAHKHYIKLKQIASKGDISGFSNFDEHQQGQIPILAKAKYSNVRDPFCFALILVDQLAASEIKTNTLATKIDAKKTPVTVPVPQGRFLWIDLDPPGTPEANWNFGGRFIENGTGKVTAIDPKDITAVGKTAVKVDVKSLPNGAVGNIEVDLKLVNRFRTGLSLGKNVICVATRAVWKQRADSDMKSTLVHEAGHKIGMVPGGGVNSLDQQSTYYQAMGGHCNHAVNTCVMYGQIHAGRDNRFCPKCQESVRKLDLDASKLPGFTPL